MGTWLSRCPHVLFFLGDVDLFVVGKYHLARAAAAAAAADTYSIEFC